MRSYNDTLSSDDILVSRYRNGREDAATALYLRYSKQLLQLASSQMNSSLSPRLGADDVVQSVFRTFFRRVNDGQYNLPNGEDLWRLLLVIALNKVRSKGVYHRAAKRSVLATTPIEQDAMNLPSNHDESQDLRILKMTIDEVLSEYPESQREVIAMRINGYGIRDIAERTGRSSRTIERTLQRFREQLSVLLEERD